MDDRHYRMNECVLYSIGGGLCFAREEAEGSAGGVLVLVLADFGL